MLEEGIKRYNEVSNLILNDEKENRSAWDYSKVGLFQDKSDIPEQTNVQRKMKARQPNGNNINKKEYREANWIVHRNPDGFVCYLN